MLEKISRPSVAVPSFTTIIDEKKDAHTVTN